MVLQACPTGYHRACRDPLLAKIQKLIEKIQKLIRRVQGNAKHAGDSQRERAGTSCSDSELQNV